MAYGDSGDALDLMARVGADGTLDWTAPAGRWTLYALFSDGTASSSSARRPAAKAT